ncbi:hypothetical protein DFQ14_101193 [Halopolyspora algeriensis]|uniref:Uncharacterized protein n=1 Tax=Halopolyspora algeriensis TaxID=1500506 RepID=A0A368W2D8_9ACTN|nr:hypothetical protein [Halopolyspora algeriensis]RCW46853.1 hypothetical protein DFQ14_101193 [Halopolyspora algeriensis]TQM47944.1 hypothetical protein FHU43_2896 [Halopolyspora algeriensis]
MTWLFTQVWLWSLAAFVLGSLLTWLLFVLPLQRRLDAARSQTDALDTVIAAPQHDGGFGDGPLVVREEEYSAWDLLRGEQDERGEWAAGPEAAESGLSEATSPHGASGAVAGIAASGEAGGVSPDVAEPGTVEIRDVSERERSFDSTSGRDPQPRSEDPDLSGRLESLFEPLVSPRIEQDRHDTPYVPPLGLEGAGASGGEAADVQGDEQPLPRRVPGATSKPGTPPQYGVAAPKFRAGRAGAEESAQHAAASEEGELEAAPPAEQPEGGPAKGSNDSPS